MKKSKSKVYYSKELFEETSTLEDVISSILFLMFFAIFGCLIWISCLGEDSPNAYLAKIVTISVLGCTGLLFYINKKLSDKQPILEEKKDGTVCVFQESEELKRDRINSKMDTTSKLLNFISRPFFAVIFTIAIIFLVKEQSHYIQWFVKISSFLYVLATFMIRVSAIKSGEQEENTEVIPSQSKIKTFVNHPLVTICLSIFAIFILREQPSFVKWGIKIICPIYYLCVLIAWFLTSLLSKEQEENVKGNENE